MAIVKRATDSISGEALAKASGKSLAEWLEILDDFNVKKNGHAAAAQYLAESFGLGPWWSQQVTVTYEQERGLRLPGQRADGTFTLTASKMIDASVESAFDAWATPDGWNSWFTSGARIDLQVGGSYSNNDHDIGVFTRIIEPGPPRSMNERARLAFTWDNAKHCPGTKVAVQIFDKGEGRCSITITHDKLKSQDDLSEMKRGWHWALASLKSYLETGKPISEENWAKQQESLASPSK